MKFSEPQLELMHSEITSTVKAEMPKKRTDDTMSGSQSYKDENRDNCS